MNKRYDLEPKMTYLPDLGGDVVLCEKGQERRTLDPNRFLEYFKEHITPGMLISDRAAQARLNDILDRKFYQENIVEGVSNHQPREGKFHNPLPKLILKSKNGGITFIHETIFELKEEDGSQHYYFFDAGNPSAEVPSFLREEDVVPSGRFSESFKDEEREKIKNEFDVSDVEIENMIYYCDPRLDEYRVLEDIPFNKSLNRVNRYGGTVERFNYRTSLWEIEENCRSYDAPIAKRVAGLAIKIAGRFISSSSPDDKKALR